MMRGAAVRVAARGGVLLTALLAGSVLAWRLLDTRVLALGGALNDDSAADAAMDFGTALTGICAAALLGTLAWLALLSAAVVLEVILAAWLSRGGASMAVGLAESHSDAPHLTTAISRTAGWCPVGLRRMLLAGCGAAVAAGLATAPATADPITADPATAADRADVTTGFSLTGLALPDRTVDVGTTHRQDVHLVGRGESLWSIAAARLEPGAADTDIAAAWRVIHRLNHDLVGPDPDVIHPGTVLKIPRLGHHEGEESP